MQLEQLIQGQAAKSALSSIANPFTKGAVQRVHLYIGRWSLRSEIVFQATIYVEQGPTKGEHAIEGRDYPDLMTRLSAALESLQ